MSTRAAVVATARAARAGARAQEARRPRRSSKSASTATTRRPTPRSSRLAGIATGQPFSASRRGRVRRNACARAAGSGASSIRKRYQSIADPSAIVLVILVEEQAGVSAETPTAGRAAAASKRARCGCRFWPSRTATASPTARGSAFVDALGRQTRVSVPSDVGW